MGALLVVVAINGLLASDLTPSWPVHEGWHLLGHFVVFSAAGYVLPFANPRWVLATVLVAGLSIEFAQSLAVGKWFLWEASFDTGVNLLSGVMGCAVGRPREMAPTLGVWLHPIVLLLATLFSMGWITGRSPVHGAWVASVVFACFLPAVAFWLHGVWRGRYESYDVRDRARRGPLFAVACLCATGVPFVLPGSLTGFGWGIALTTYAVTLLTIAGFKVSGHVTGAVVPAAAMVPFSWRGSLVLGVAGVVLSWARVADRCHTPLQVAGAWALAFVVLIVQLGP